MDLVQRIKVQEVQINLLTDENEKLKCEIQILKDIIQIKEQVITALHKTITTSN